MDSTIDLPEQYRRQVHIVPLTIHFGTEELLDGVDIDRQRFYERLVESDVLPTTSQPSLTRFRPAVRSGGGRRGQRRGADHLPRCPAPIRAPVSPPRDGRISLVVDTMSASIGSGILARYAIDNAHLPAGDGGVAGAAAAGRVHHRWWTRWSI
ncbi:MAG: DegV family protein [Dysosmobacter sp.]